MASAIVNPVSLNFTKTPLALLVDLINGSNTATSAAFTTSLLTFAAPTVIATPDAEGRDTSVVLTAAAGSGYTGSQTVTYRRVPLSDLTAGKATADITFQLGDATTFADIVDEVNAKFGINLTADDYTDVAMPTFGTVPNESKTLTVSAKAGSYVWAGSFTLTIDGNDIPLSSIVTTTALNGLSYEAKSNV